MRNRNFSVLVELDWGVRGMKARKVFLRLADPKTVALLVAAVALAKNLVQPDAKAEDLPTA